MCLLSKVTQNIDSMDQFSYNHILMDFMAIQVPKTNLKIIGVSSSPPARDEPMPIGPITNMLIPVLHTSIECSHAENSLIGYCVEQLQRLN